MPRYMQEALGKYVVIKSYADANHVGNMANRRLHYGIIIYVNNSPVIWYSKRQNKFLDSSFVSKCVALMIATEMIEALRYKLNCFGVPIDILIEVFCDNKSVVNKLIIPTSVLNNIYNATCYHRVREAQDEAVICIGWIPGLLNLDDLFTKTIMPGSIRNNLVK